MLAQNISVQVLGPVKETMITLDLDLYRRGMKIQQSVQNKNWILLPGSLHIFFASLHALGKIVDGSGLVTCAVECGLFSSSSLSAVYSGKKYYRGVEYHLITASALKMLKFDALSCDIDFHGASVLYQNFVKFLNNNCPRINEAYINIEEWYQTNIKSRENISHLEGLGRFLQAYLEQVNNLLLLISSCRSGNLELYLASVENQVKYFVATDLLNYARLMPIFLGQMASLEKEDPQSWKSLKEGDFVVKKSTVSFTALGIDQAL